MNLFTGCWRCFPENLPDDQVGVSVVSKKNYEEDLQMVMFKGKANRPSPVTVDITKGGKRVLSFVPVYCPFCGRKLDENNPYI